MEMFQDLIKQRNHKKYEVENARNKIERLKEQIDGIEKQIIVENRRLEEFNIMIKHLEGVLPNVQGDESKT